MWAGDAAVVSLPPNADAKAEVLAAFAEQLRFPRGFRPTWDDLELCLRDLSWLAEPTVVVLHAALPRLSHNALAVYLDVLQNAALLRNPGSPRLICVFPSDARDYVTSLLSVG
ncbi:MAG: hypothetical protein CVU56_22010 [Deltaproteobacteria bacterium HGW-Deltaproteobacteria-14]|nr:MAG: hypothetical protein CVU56_22010 [Deltaproteobacteria bacterium HGW-Deltaproteobacteria-14]